MTDSRGNGGGKRPSRRSVIASIAAGSASLGVSSVNAKAHRKGYNGLASTNADGIAYDASPGARRRSVSGKLGEQVSVLDFDVDPSGRNDSSQGFRTALEQSGTAQLLIPRGTYLVQQLPILGPAGRKIIGESRWQTILRSENGGLPIFLSPVAKRSTSAFHLLQDFTIDLGGQDIIAIDLASVNMATLQRLHIRGAEAGVKRAGTGVRFAAPLRKGAYDNSVYDCSFEYLDRAVMWAEGANNNSVFNCRITNCETGYHAAPGGRGVDTPRIVGGRLEQCGVGIAEGASQGAYFGLRFEGSSEADVRFYEGSQHAGIWGGYTAGSSAVLKDMNLAASPHIESGDLGYYAIEERGHRPRYQSGRHVIAAAGKTPKAHPKRNYAVFFDDYVLMNNETAVEFSNAARDDRVIGVKVNAADNLVISGYDRKKGQYSAIELGGGAAVRPIGTGITDLGSADHEYRKLCLSDGVFVAGKRVAGPRQAAISDDRSNARNRDVVNQILNVMRNAGLIEK